MSLDGHHLGPPTQPSWRSKIYGPTIGHIAVQYSVLLSFQPYNVPESSRSACPKTPRTYGRARCRPPRALKTTISMISGYAIIRGQQADQNWSPARQAYNILLRRSCKKPEATQLIMLKLQDNKLRSEFFATRWIQMYKIARTQLHDHMTVRIRAGITPP